jgi:preprotein translocase subunit SecD
VGRGREASTVADGDCHEANTCRLLRVRWPLVFLIACKAHPHKEIVLELDRQSPVCRAGITDAVGIDRALEVLRPRLDEMGAGVALERRDDKLVIELPIDTDAEFVGMMQELALRTATVEMKVVDDDSPYMAEQFKHVASDPDAAAMGIRAESDRGQAGPRERHSCWLRADDRDADVTVDDARAMGCVVRASKIDDGKVSCRVTGRKVIETYLAKLAKQDPTFAIPGDRQVGFELVASRHDRTDKPRYWRTYYLEREAGLTGASIANVSRAFDPDVVFPVVVIDFTSEGAKRFEELTARIIGKQLATILDDKVKSTVVINAPLHGSRASIKMDGSDDDSVTERDELVEILRIGALPCPLRPVAR